VLKSKFNIALIIGIIFMLSLIAVWYVTPAPTVSPLIVSDLENLNAVSIMEGTAGKEGYLLIQSIYGVWEVPIRIEAHLNTTNVIGDNIILRINATVIRSDTNETIPDLSGTSTYVFNKLTHENVWGAPEADKNRTGYDPFYPSHLKAGENITNAWLDNLDETGTLKFVRAVKKEDVELYEYFVNKTVTKKMVLPGVNYDNYTLTSIKTVLIEPLSGIPAYTQEETLIIWGNWFNTDKNATMSNPLIYVTYHDRAPDLVTARLASGAMGVLEFDKEAKGWILGAAVVILTITFILNTRSLTRKPSPQAKT
jgi:hypothetical protein